MSESNPETIDVVIENDEKHKTEQNESVKEIESRKDDEKDEEEPKTTDNENKCDDNKLKTETNEEDTTKNTKM